MPVSTFENHCLGGELTFGDPFLDSGVVHTRFIGEGWRFGPSQFMFADRLSGIKSGNTPHSVLLFFFFIDFKTLKK